MLNHAIFLDLAGVKNSMRSMQITANNLANLNTVGFQADYLSAQAYTIGADDQMQSRTYADGYHGYTDFSQGPITSTGRNLDVAIDGPGFIAVQTKDGKEAYTRAGNLQINTDGLLMTGKGDLVVGSRGVITIPPASQVTITENGEVSAKAPTDSENQIQQLGQIKLVKLPLNQAHKGEDGLIYLNEDATPDLSSVNPITLVPRSLEGSNVNAMLAMADLIDRSRNFEMHTKLMKTVEDNSSLASQLLNIAK